MLTGLYLMNHRSGRNGTPLDTRHTNLALEARRGGYDPTLFGYTDTSADPRGRDPGDPALTTYEGPMPGFHRRDAVSRSRQALDGLSQEPRLRLPQRAGRCLQAAAGLRAAAGPRLPRHSDHLLGRGQRNHFHGRHLPRLGLGAAPGELVRACRLPAPASADHRARALEHALRSRGHAADAACAQSRGRRRAASVSRLQAQPHPPGRRLR